MHAGDCGCQFHQREKVISFKHFEKLFIYFIDYFHWKLTIYVFLKFFLWNKHRIHK